VLDGVLDASSVGLTVAGATEEVAGVVGAGEHAVTLAAGEEGAASSAVVESVVGVG